MSWSNQAATGRRFGERRKRKISPFPPSHALGLRLYESHLVQGSAIKGSAIDVVVGWWPAGDVTF